VAVLEPPRPPPFHDPSPLLSVAAFRRCLARGSDAWAALSSSIGYSYESGSHDRTPEGSPISTGPTLGSESIRGYDRTSNLARTQSALERSVLATKGAPALVRGGESAAARCGREIHKTFEDRVVVELKPNNPAAIRRGQRTARRLQARA
jgi:hypothetical protein